MVSRELIGEHGLQVGDTAMAVTAHAFGRREGADLLPTQLDLPPLPGPLWVRAAERLGSGAIVTYDVTEFVVTGVDNSATRGRVLATNKTPDPGTLIGSEVRYPRHFDQFVTGKLSDSTTVALMTAGVEIFYALDISKGEPVRTIHVANPYPTLGSFTEKKVIHGTADNPTRTPRLISRTPHRR